MSECKYDVSICMQATSMFDNANLDNEISFVIEQEMTDGCFELEGVSEEDLDKLMELSIDTIMKYTKYSKDDLTVSNCDWDTGELNIYFNIPVRINVEALLNL